MDDVFICPECGVNGIDNFLEYQEICVTEWRKITKDGKVSRKVNDIDKDKSTMPWGLKCNNCRAFLNYYTDEQGKICEITTKK